MFFPFYGPTMIILIPGILIAIWAQMKVKSTFAKWSKVRTSQNITGAEIAKTILNQHGLDEIPIRETKGKLTDNYNPVKRTLNLSQSVYDSSSVAAVGVAAHEAGHAIQHNKGYAPLLARNGIFPLAKIGSWLPYPLFIIGFIMGHPLLIKIGIYLFSGFVAFTVITLPVEFNASKRAIMILRQSDYLTGQELVGVREVLSAASLTYVAAALSAVLSLLRLLILSGRRD